jgi:hypothetical protein
MTQRGRMEAPPFEQGTATASIDADADARTSKSRLRVLTFAAPRPTPTARTGPARRRPLARIRHAHRTWERQACLSAERLCLAAVGQPAANSITVVACLPLWAHCQCGQDAGGVIGLCYGHYGEASDSIDDLLDWVAEATAGWTEHGFASMQAAIAEFKAMCGHLLQTPHCPRARAGVGANQVDGRFTTRLPPSAAPVWCSCMFVCCDAT